MNFGGMVFQILGGRDTERFVNQNRGCSVGITSTHHMLNSSPENLRKVAKTTDVVDADANHQTLNLTLIMMLLINSPTFTRDNL